MKIVEGVFLSESHCTECNVSHPDPVRGLKLFSRVSNVGIGEELRRMDAVWSVQLLFHCRIRRVARLHSEWMVLGSGGRCDCVFCSADYAWIRSEQYAEKLVYGTLGVGFVWDCCVFANAEQNRLRLSYERARSIVRSHCDELNSQVWEFVWKGGVEGHYDVDKVDVRVSEVSSEFRFSMGDTVSRLNKLKDLRLIVEVADGLWRRMEY